MSAQPLLVYFDAQGRAEAIRLLLAEANVDFEDRRFRPGVNGMADFEKFKTQEYLPFDQLPIWKDQNLVLAQSQAILRHLARQHNLVGKSPEEMALADMTACGVDDLWCRFTSSVAADNVARDIRGSSYALSTIPEEFTKEILPKWNRYFERLLEKAGSGYMTESFTYADICVFDAMERFTSACPGCLDAFPRLKDHHERVRNRPRILSWLERRPKASF
eukprot:Protomagalhaensia_sp_Gyna_25__3053@NODE_280_length_4063_cov_674_606859_g215_i0_p3_GENE_NODE_280_length_4063_cov_674_606859_g215_i0NODE_280_length_4063_cov_674_606859_g215_i0_p3_ORF_typecomplete_len219_score28_16GST_C_3/PF14497_6/3_1e20GST_N/PF02798_20/8_6e14GST_C/PF00043_25/1_4e07GST_N_3/PF13417_6/6_3e06GST_N_3/PF13417_6/5_2e03GST_C_2/PF13410_6/0_0042GST_C_5/PF16865_5/8e03GST_C_5/PF16865_5/0_1DUF2333/PF10095_9/2_7DUF2333/PF10095_9/1_6e02DUF2333/PF10095_9/3_2e03Tom37/PF10568_9/0_73Tom37/PF10568_9